MESLRRHQIVRYAWVADDALLLPDSDPAVEARWALELRGSQCDSLESASRFVGVGERVRYASAAPPGEGPSLIAGRVPASAVSEPASTPIAPLRLALDVIPIRDGGQRLFLVRDRVDPARSPIVVSETALHLASLFDGQRTARGVQVAFELRTGQRVQLSELVGFVERLEEAHLLDSDCYGQYLETQKREFRQAAERLPVHAGGAYPGTRGDVEPFLDSLYLAEDGPGSPPGPATGRSARALVAPHIDLHRGGPTYAWTYRALAECAPAEVYVLLGTCHTPMTTPLAAIRKPYGTPLGPAPVDTDLLEELEEVFRGDLYVDEFNHRGEHSLEFQALYLRYLGLVGESGASILPLLCGSLHEWAHPDQSPTEAPPIQEVIESLREVLAGTTRRVCLIAGADLAHVGPQFGDSLPVDRTSLAAVQSGDLEMLEYVCHGDAEGFYRQVMSDKDARRICGLSPIYYLLALVGSSSGRLLKYSQWSDPQGHGAVTYAGIIFEAE